MSESQTKSKSEPNQPEVWFSDKELKEAGIARNSNDPKDMAILAAMIRSKKKEEAQ